MESVPTKNLQETFSSFRERCVWVQTCFNTFEALYSSGHGVEKLLRETAPAFFGDVNVILQEYILLQICNLTDPAESFDPALRRRVPNLTVAHLNELLRVEGLMTPEIEIAAKGLAHYRNLVERSRNKLISHFDKTTVLAGNALGAHARSDVDAFFENLHQYCDGVGHSVLEGPLDFSVTSGPGDALDLLKHLNGGLYPHG